MQKQTAGQPSGWVWRHYLAFVGLALSLYVFESLSAFGALAQWGGLVIVFALVAIILYPTRSAKQFLSMLDGAKIELRKVAWPSRDETVRVTALVCTVVVIVALLLWVIDRSLMAVVSHFAG